MNTQIRKLNKQSLLIGSALVISWVLGFYATAYTLDYIWFVFYALAALFIFVPPMALSYFRVRHNRPLGKLPMFIRAGCWLSIALMSLPFALLLLGILFEPFVPFRSVFTTLIMKAQMFWDVAYFADTDYGLLADVVALAWFLPYAIIAMLLYRASKISKLLAQPNRL